MERVHGDYLQLLYVGFGRWLVDELWHLNRLNIMVCWADVPSELDGSAGQDFRGFHIVLRRGIRDVMKIQNSRSAPQREAGTTAGGKSFPSHPYKNTHRRNAPNV